MEKHTLNFRASNGYPSRCQIQIYRQTQLVIATDIDKGMSVTNACEIIANQVVQQFGVKPHQMFFIEEYRPAGPNHTTDVRRQVKVDKWGENEKRQFSKLFHSYPLGYVQFNQKSAQPI